jgi:PTS system mannose-specific IID component
VLFNAHPYLTSIAMGAIQKAESEGADPERIRRLGDALRSPLGSLGDRLIWGAWRPACLLGAIVIALMDGPAWLVLGGFLLSYNLLHLPLRLRGAAVGLATGLDVARGIRELNLAAKAERTARAGVLLLGVTVGIGVATGLRLPSHGVALVVGALACFLAGFARGESLRGWAPILLLAIVLAGFVMGPALAGSGVP